MWSIVPSFDHPISSAGVYGKVEDPDMDEAMQERRIMIVIS